jgi:hypothetical protein
MSQFHIDQTPRVKIKQTNYMFLPGRMTGRNPILAHIDATDKCGQARLFWRTRLPVPWARGGSSASVLKVEQTVRDVVTRNPVTGRVYSVCWLTNRANGFTKSVESHRVYSRQFHQRGAGSTVNRYQIQVRLL